jgi:CBS domain-containing protein
MQSASTEGQVLYAGPPFDEARVGDAMRVGVITCEPETSLRDVASMMVTYDVHSIVVKDVTPGSRPWGIVTSLDIAAASRSDMFELKAARDVASTDLVTVVSNDPLTAATKLMTEHGITHLIVIAPETDSPVGVLSARDIAAVLTAPTG